MDIRFALVFLFVLMVQLVSPTLAAEKAFYVSTKGNDSWSGTLSAPNRQKTDGPFATITRVRDAVRALKKDQGELKQPVTVYIRGGVYRLQGPVVFTPEDSGTATCPVTYTAYKGENPAFSGGEAITGWKQVTVDGKKLWAVDLPEVKAGNLYFRQLFADGRRLSRTRLPKDGFYHFAGLVDAPADVQWNQGQGKMKYADDNIKPWKNLSDVEITAFHFWVDSHLPITSIDEQSKVVTFGKTSVFRLTEEYNGQKGARYFVENVSEALDTPGQWYLDRPSGTLYYYAAKGEDPNRMTFVAPRLSQLVAFDGNASENRFVEHINFKGIGFQHTEWTLPADQSGSAQAAYLVPGAIILKGARFCSVNDCRISQIGNYAIELEDRSEDNTIAGNIITDLGAGGIKIGHGTKGTVVSDNEIGKGGRAFESAIGVWVGNSGHNKVVHNHIYDFYYTGVSVGWTWGYGASDAVENEIAYNHIHQIGQGWLSDLAAIYTLGISPGTVIHHNLIHDCISAGYGGWGIYLDEGSTNILVKDNIVYRTKTGGFHQHYGKENRIQNNIFALNKEFQLQRTRMEPHLSFKFERNIIYFKDGVLLGSNWGDGKFKMDYNVYYNASGKPIDFAGVSLDDWRKEGFDIHSIIGDPKFTDPDNGDFTLQPDSPALKVGFQSIDLSGVGPRR